MGVAAVRRDPRAARARLLGPLDRPRLRRCAGAAAVGRARVEQVRSRPTGGCGTSSPSCASRARPTAEVERARAYAAGARAIAFENTGAVARHAAQQTIVYGEDVDPDRAIALLDEVTFDEVAEVAARRSPTSCRSRASARTRWRSSSRPEPRASSPGAVAAAIVLGGRAAASATRASRSAALGRGRLAGRRRRRRAAAAQPLRHRPPPAADRARRRARPRSSRAAGPAHAARSSTTSTHGEQLFALRADVKRPPASVEKLYTTVAVLARARARRAAPDDGARRPATSAPAASGTANLYLRGGGDPTLRRRRLQPGLGAGLRPDRRRSSSRQLPARRDPPRDRARDRRRVAVRRAARRARHRLRAGHPRPRRPAGGAHLRPRRDDAARSAPAAFAAQELVLTMRGAGIRARAAPVHRRGTPPRRARSSRSSPRRRCRCC